MTPEAAIASAIDLASVADARSRVYGLLSAVYRRELTADDIGLWRGMRAELEAAGLQLDAEFMGSPPDQLATRLACDYAMLYVGPGPHLAPYESVQLEGGSGLLRGPESAAVHAFIEGTGFAYAADYHGMHDHIAVQLEFLGHLAGQEAAAWRGHEPSLARHIRSYQAAFLERHLGRWVTPFCSRASRRAETGFYREIALMTSDFVTAERELLDTDSV